MLVCPAMERTKQAFERLIASSLWHGICNEFVVAIKAGTIVIGNANPIPHVQFIAKTAELAARLERDYGTKIKEVLDLGILSRIDFACIGDMYD